MSDIAAERAGVIKEIERINDLGLLRALRYLIQSTLKAEARVSIDQYNQELQEAELRVAEGEFFSQEDAEKMSHNWK
ncbi:MAG: hypothetical protein ACK5DD_14125 [Cyclobacteriaceae bacterium]|jgi:hypothetical protein